MSKIKCPGQDTRFWTPKDIFEVPCGECGYSIEFFKDDAKRRCPNCGTRVVNPELSLGCAQWCQYAKECLGFDPKELQAQLEGQASLADQLIEAMKQEFKQERARISHTLTVLDYAERIMAVEGGDPRVVISAAVLHDIGIPAAEREHGSAAGRFQEMEGPPVARRIMKGLELDVDTVEHVCRIVGSHHSGGDIDTLEFRIVWDADQLVNLADTLRQASESEREASIEKAFRTRAGKELAYRESAAGAAAHMETENDANTTERDSS